MIETPMNSSIDVQRATDEDIPIPLSQIEHWATAVLDAMNTQAELSIRLVDEQEMTRLNFDYRQINKSTNVLAFPASIPEYIALEVPLIGDVIICPTVLKKESLEQAIPLAHHWAHIITHGILHLLGYDHLEDNDTLVMQQHEVNILARFSINNPYEK